MYPATVNSKLPELIQLESLLEPCRRLGRVEIVDEVLYQGLKLPLHKVVLGNPAPEAPVLVLTGGVHGLERIGSQVVLAFLETVLELLQWDKLMQRTLQEVRLVFMPIVNPVGMLNRSRCNGNGVDLMRNAPVEALSKASTLVGGQRISSRMPWYRGKAGAPMERENQALVQVVESEVFHAQAAISLDLHSGFGVQDQIWFPYAKTTEPFPDLAELSALTELLNRSHPHHFYKIEPQAKNYTTHGDIWDYLYDEHRERWGGKVKYLPLTLEMGSWIWVKKNPKQIFSLLGPFNPIKPHRQARILRRHNTLFEFLLRAISSHSQWSELSPDRRSEFNQKARVKWYGE